MVGSLGNGNTLVLIYKVTLCLACLVLKMDNHVLNIDSNHFGVAKGIVASLNKFSRDPSHHETECRVLAHLSKSNSRTFQGLSRTIRRIYKEN